MDTGLDTMHDLMYLCFVAYSKYLLKAKSLLDCKASSCTVLAKSNSSLKTELLSNNCSDQPAPHLKQCT